MEENNANFHQVEGGVKEHDAKITTNAKEGEVVYMSMDEIKEKSLKEISDKNVVVETSTEEILKEYISDENNLKRLDELAIQFNTFTRGKWFTLNDLSKKVLKDMKPYISLYMDLLVMTNKAFAKKKGEMVVYKITLNKDQRKKIIQNYIVELESSLDHYRKELESLN